MVKVPELACPFTAGLHPWHADQLSISELATILDNLGNQPNLLAFGETGFDKKCKIPMGIQKEIFSIHLEKALFFRKPLIIHCYKGWDEIIAWTKTFPNSKILHGFHEGIALTQRLIREGFAFSIGEAILHQESKLVDSIHHIPIDRLFLETDESEIPIEEIYQQTAKILRMDVENLKQTIYTNYRMLIQQ